MVDVVVFVVTAVICVVGALGVILLPNPVHAALSLVATLFGVAVVFVAEEAHFLAVVQVIVYAGAIVVLFLFVIMLLGVDKTEQLRIGALVGQREAAAVFALGAAGLVVALAVGSDQLVTGAPSLGGFLDPAESNVALLARSLFEDHVYAFELTSVLLVIAVIGAVVLARRPSGDAMDVHRTDRRDDRVDDERPAAESDGLG